MKRVLATAAAAALTLGVGLAGATAAGAAPAEPSDVVDLMPGAVDVHTALITDDAVYAISSEPGRGDEIFSRTLEQTESGVVLGASTRIARASGPSLVEHDGTLAYLAPDTGHLVFRAPDGTTSTPAWATADFWALGGPSAMTESWLLVGDAVVDRETGTLHALRDLPVVTLEGEPVDDIPANISLLEGRGAALSEERVMWAVWGSSGAPDYDRYAAVMVADLHPDGTIGTAVRVAAEISDTTNPFPSLRVAGLAEGTYPAWFDDASGEDIQLVWMDESLSGETTSVEVTGHRFSQVLEVDGPVLTLVEQVPGGERALGDVRRINLAGDPTVPELTGQVSGWVLDTDGSLVAYHGQTNGEHLLVDLSGRTVTADDTLPPPVVRFTDVGLSHPFYADIDSLAASFIARGYDDGSFRGAAPVSRQAMAAFLIAAADNPVIDGPATSPFPDVDESNQFYWSIRWLVQEGITGGYADGTFRPTAPVSRQAMAAFLYRFAGSPEVEVDGAPFPDVPAGSEFAAAVTWLAGTGITGGYDDGTFRPTAPVSRQAMAAFLHRFVDKGYVPPAQNL